MRIAEYRQISTETITNTIVVDDYNEDGEVIGQHTETVTEEKPIMGFVYRDATPEEEAESERLAADIPEPAPTLEEQLADLTDLVTILTEVIAND